MRVAGLAALVVCLATAALRVTITPDAAGRFALRAGSSTDGGPGVEDGTIKYQRLR